MEHLSAERDAFARNLDALKASRSSSAKKVHASTNTDYQFVDSSTADLQSCTLVGASNTKALKTNLLSRSLRMDVKRRHC
jgi:hypothetical protein